jgi:pyocin large subunit-like protein
MPKWTAWILPFVVVGGAAILGGILGGNGAGPSKHDAAAAPAAHVTWSRGHDGASANAQEHWEKHGGDFPELHDAQSYERAARSFVAAPPSGTLTKHRANGDTLFYDPATNTFAVADPDGEPRTFFRPNSGRAYWERQ